MAVIELDRAEVEQLPAVCMRCGAPATARVRKRFSRLSTRSLLGVLVALPLGIGIIVSYRGWHVVYLPVWIGACVVTLWTDRKAMPLEAPFCAAHRRHWQRRIQARALIALAGVLPLMAATAYLVLPALPRQQAPAAPAPVVAPSRVAEEVGKFLNIPPEHRGRALDLWLGAAGLGLLATGVLLVVYHTAIRATSISKQYIGLAGVDEKFVAAVGAHRRKDRASTPPPRAPY